MRMTIKPPVTGQSLSTTWGRKLASDIRAGRIVGGEGIDVRYTPNGTMVSLSARSGSTAVTSQGFAPWDIVWMPKSENDETIGEWQIYMPMGCLMVETWANSSGSALIRKYAALCSNSEAIDKEGNHWYGWYTIPNPSSENANISSVGDFQVTSWIVYAQVKPWARYVATTAPKDEEPVAWSIAIAMISEWKYRDEDGKQRACHYVDQYTNGMITKSWDASKPFAIDYELESPKEYNSEHKVNIINQNLIVGRLNLSQESVNLSGAEEVWLTIEHDGSDISMSVSANPSSYKSNDDLTVLKLYDLKDDVVQADYRSSIPELPFYTNPANDSNSVS